MKVLEIPPKGQKSMIELKQCPYHNLPYIATSHQLSFWYNQLPPTLQHVVWTLTVGNNDTITAGQVYIGIEKPSER